MRRRLLLVILGTVLSALTLAALISFFGIRSASIDRAKTNLADQGLGLVRQGANNVDRLKAFSSALDLESATVWEIDEETARVGLEPANSALIGNVALESGGTARAIKRLVTSENIRELINDKEVTGSLGDRVYAAVHVKGPTNPPQVLLLVKNVSGDAREAVRIIALSSIAALLLAGIAAFAVARQISRPLVAATGAYRRIASGDLSVRLSAKDRTSMRKDEVGDLVRSLNAMTEALDRAQKQEQQFLLSVSHDLRTPLTSIRGFAEAISEGTAPDQQRAASVIASQARRLERLVADLLELAKLDAKRFALQPRSIDLTDLVTDTADGFLPNAQASELTLELEAEEDLRATVDPERVAQILANLTENAIKYARTRVVVGARRSNETPHDRGRKFVELSISDDGPGIDLHDLPQVFERHFTSDRRPTRAIGSGLGLAIVKELVDAMDATITPTTSSEGTTFTVRLPVNPTVQ
jgi:signal transduction histidine kinase